MYVKVLDHGRNRAAVIYTTDPSQPISFGLQRLERDPSQLSWAELTEELRVGADSMDRTHVGSNPTGYRGPEGDSAYWEVGWVRFHKPDDRELHMVAATTPIYLLDDSGKTIDRV